MADVKVVFQGDTSSLSKAARDAVDKLKSVDKAAKTAQGSTKGLSQAATGLQRGLAATSAGTRQAQLALTNFNRVVQDAPFGFLAIQNNIDPLIDSFISLRRETGSSRKALGALVGAFSGPAGILTVVSLASTAFLAFGDRIVEAFNKGKKAADEAKKAFASVLDDTISFEGLQGETVEFRTIESVQEAIAAISEQIEKTESDITRFEQQRVQAGFAAGTQSLRGDGSTSGSDRASELSRNIVESETRLAKLRETLAAFEAQTVRFKASEDLKAILGGLGDRETTSTESPVVPQVQSLTTAVQELQGAQVELITTNENLITSENLRQIEDQESIDLIRQRQQAYIALIQSLNVGQDTFLRLGEAGAQAVADLALGFENLEGVINGLKGVVRGLLSDLIKAAARAAILTTLFPGAAGLAGGFGGIFRSSLGLIPFASGGIVTGPTPALIGEAGPEAVIPLDKLGGINKVQIEATTLRFDGNQFLLDIRQAQNTKGVGF